MLAHFSLLDAFFSFLAASWALVGHFLVVLVVFFALWTAPGSILEGLGQLRGGFWKLRRPIFRGFFARGHHIAQTTPVFEKFSKTSTGAIKFKVSALTPYAQISRKTAKSRSRSLSNRLSHKGRAQNASSGSPSSILEGSGALLGVSWPPPGRFSVPLGRFLGVCWALLGAS